MADMHVDRPLDGFVFPDLGFLPDYQFYDAKPPTIDRCGGGAIIDVLSGTKTFTGDTSEATNEYGHWLDCGGTTPLVGPQLYYRVDLVAERTYRFTLSPEFEAFFFLTSSCGSTAMNIECSSGGSSGIMTGPITAGETGSITFKVKNSGTYHLAVDSAAATNAGAFSFTVEEFNVPENGVCTRSDELKFIGDKATVSGFTLGAKNEYAEKIGCGLGVSFDGPQVYYQVELSSSQWYEISLDADYAASVYLFTEEAACQVNNMEKDCSTFIGTVLPFAEPGKKISAAYSPTADGKFIVAVDSVDPVGAGAFSLEIAEYSPSGNMICENAEALPVVDGVASIVADTTGMLNDLGAHLYCGPTPRFIGPQAYYTVALEKKTYRVSLQSNFDASLLVGQSCLTMPVDCGSGGLAGGNVAVPISTTGAITFTPQNAGTYYLAVDGANLDAMGSFQLRVEEATPPTNGSCAEAQVIDLQAGPVNLVGDTGPLKNDLVGIDCDHLNGPWPGPQAYYRVAVPAGKTLNVDLLSQSSFDGALYVFDASAGCEAAAVNAACAGLASDAKGDGVAEHLSLQSVSDAEYILVVDSWSASEVGVFTLQLSLL
jgi:hypothetical protein